jgi:hypothetical protein
MIMIFYDSVAPQLIPEGGPACLYYDGIYAAEPAAADRFKAVRWITVFGDYEHCGIADYETGNEVYSKPGAIEAFVRGRMEMGKRARVYCNRVSLAEVRQRLEGLDWLLWIATLDGDQLSPSYATNLWAVQYAGGVNATFDISVLYGAW